MVSECERSRRRPHGNTIEPIRFRSVLETPCTQTLVSFSDRWHFFSSSVLIYIIVIFNYCIQRFTPTSSFYYNINNTIIKHCLTYRTFGFVFFLFYYYHSIFNVVHRAVTLRPMTSARRKRLYTSTLVTCVISLSSSNLVSKTFAYWEDCKSRRLLILSFIIINNLVSAFVKKNSNGVDH
jgi:hypothetical protein